MTGPEQSHYGFNERQELLPFLPPRAATVLDVGCASGGLGKTLRSHFGSAAYLLGLDALETSVAQAKATSAYDDVVQGYFPDDLRGDRLFDLILFADVLEHMYDPWAAVAAAKDKLTRDGLVVASLPSIQFGPVVWALLKGRWDYADEGTLDRTHLRFFTRATMCEMFEDAGYQVERCEGINPVAGLILDNAKSWKAKARGHLLRRLPAFDYLQYAIVAKAKQ